MAEVKELLKDIKETLKDNHKFPHNECHDVSHLFPAESLRDLNTFLVEDGNLEKRKKGLYNMLLLIDSPDQGAFRRAFIDALFKRELCQELRWPPN